jgi:hypothetical protein
MGKQKKKPQVGGSVMFDVIYQDGTRSSHRKVPIELVDGVDGDAPAKAAIEAQDREIAERSGRPRGPIKTISRSGGR